MDRLVRTLLFTLLLFVAATMLHATDGTLTLQGGVSIPETDMDTQRVIKGAWGLSYDHWFWGDIGLGFNPYFTNLKSVRGTESFDSSIEGIDLYVKVRPTKLGALNFGEKSIIRRISPFVTLGAGAGHHGTEYRWDHDNDPTTPNALLRRNEYMFILPNASAGVSFLTKWGINFDLGFRYDHTNTDLIETLAPDNINDGYYTAYAGIGVRTGVPQVKETVVKPSPLPPFVLATFTGIPDVNNQVDLIWETEKDTGIRGYYIYRSTEKDIKTSRLISPFIAGAKVDGNKTYTSLDPDELAPGTYYYWLARLDDLGSTVYHGPIEVKIIQPSDAKIDFISFDAMPNPNNTVNLEWKTKFEEGVRGYYLYRGTSNDLASAFQISPFIPAFNKKEPQTYPYLDATTLNPGTHYYWLLHVDQNGKVDYRGPLEVKIEGTEVLVTTPKPQVELVTFTGTPRADKLVELNWQTSAEAGIQSYYVSRGVTGDRWNAGQISPLIPALNLSEQQTYPYLDIDKLEPGTYYYWLTQVGMNGELKDHGPIVVEIKAPEVTQPPLPEISINTFTAKPLTGNQVDLRWETTNERGIQGYTVLRGTMPDLNVAAQITPLMPAVNSGGRQVYPYVDTTSLAPGTYYYWLSYIDDKGETQYSGPVVVEIKAPEIVPPTMPELSISTFTALPAPGNQVDLKWETTAEKGIQGYTIYRGNSPELPHAEQITPLMPAINSGGTQIYPYLDTTSLAPGTYYYWLSYQDMDGKLNYQGPISVVITATEPELPPVTPTLSKVEISGFRGLPNDNGNVDLSWDTNLETGIQGYTIYRGTSDNFTAAAAISPFIPARNANLRQTYNYIDTSGLAPGTYYYWLSYQGQDGVTSNHGPIVVVVRAKPTTPETPPTPETQPTQVETQVPALAEIEELVALTVVNFETNYAVINAQDKKKLDALAAALKKFPEVRLMVQGHTDNTGNQAINEPLSVRRAQSVKDYLVSKGIAASRLQIKGYSDTKPIDTNSTAAGRARNRRTDFTIIK